MKQMIAPNGLKIVGTAEVINGTALVKGWSDAGIPDYEGSTDIDWDSQLTRSNEAGAFLVVDEDGETHVTTDCTLVDE